MAVAVVVDLAELGAVLLVAAAEAVLKARGFPIVSVVSRDVAAVTAAVALHVSRALLRALVTVHALLSTPEPQENNRWAGHLGYAINRWTAHLHPAINRCGTHLGQQSTGVLHNIHLSKVG